MRQYEAGDETLPRHVEGENMDRLSGTTLQRPGSILAMIGVLAFALGWIRNSRALRTLGFVFAAGGAGLYARGRIAERAEKIEAAQSHIRSELEELDPVARAQVLADVARSEI
jgi:hypothetical protein